MPIALANRPEIASRRALVQAAEVAVRREKARPFIPDDRAQRLPDPVRDAPGRDLRPRPQQQPEPVDGPRRLQHPAASGSSRIAGSATSRMIKSAARQQSLAIIEFFKVQDMVAEEVTQALARCSRRRPGSSRPIARSRTGIITFNGTFEGLKQTSRFGDVLVLISRPQEAVYALQLLKVPSTSTSRRWPSTTGRSSSCSTRWATRPRRLRKSSRLARCQPVDTARPTYLPPVGNGPPPATR